MFQLSSLFYVCYVIYIFLPVEGPIPLRDEYYLQHGLFRSIVDFIWAKGENPGAGFPSSHVAIAFLVAWWGSRYFPRLRIFYWLTFLFLSIATVYCMFHYAVDVMGGLCMGVLAVLLFAWVDRDNAKGSWLTTGCIENESSGEDPFEAVTSWPFGLIRCPSNRAMESHIDSWKSEWTHRPAGIGKPYPGPFRKIAR